MVDLVAVGLRLAVTTASLFVAVYCFRLQSSFKGGVYASILTLLGEGAVLLIIGEVIGTIALVTKIYDLFWATNVLEVLFFAMLTLAIRRFYRTWKIGFGRAFQNSGQMTLEEKLVSLYGREGARLILRYPNALPTSK